MSTQAVRKEEGDTSRRRILLLFNRIKERKHELGLRCKVKELFEVLQCPITYELMLDPVVVNTDTVGHSYEKVAMTEWFEQEGTSPLKTELLNLGTDPELIPNKTLKAVIWKLIELYDMTDDDGNSSLHLLANLTPQEAEEAAEAAAEAAAAAAGEGRMGRAREAWPDAAASEEGGEGRGARGEGRGARGEGRGARGDGRGARGEGRGARWWGEKCGAVAIKKDLQCPITQEVMRDPVVAANGFSYERDAIVERNGVWVDGPEVLRARSDPNLPKEVSGELCTPNFTLKAVIQKLIDLYNISTLDPEAVNGALVPLEALQSLGGRLREKEKRLQDKQSKSGVSEEEAASEEEIVTERALAQSMKSKAPEGKHDFKLEHLNSNVQGDDDAERVARELLKKKIQENKRAWQEERENLLAALENTEQTEATAAAGARVEQLAKEAEKLERLLEERGGVIMDLSDL
jgi:hypothetical protein